MLATRLRLKQRQQQKEATARQEQEFEAQRKSANEKKQLQEKRAFVESFAVCVMRDLIPLDKHFEGSSVLQLAVKYGFRDIEDRLMEHFAKERKDAKQTGDSLQALQVKMELAKQQAETEAQKEATKKDMLVSQKLGEAKQLTEAVKALDQKYRDLQAQIAAQQEFDTLETKKAALKGEADDWLAKQVSFCKTLALDLKSDARIDSALSEMLSEKDTLILERQKTETTYEAICREKALSVLKESTQKKIQRDVARMKKDLREKAQILRGVTLSLKREIAGASAASLLTLKEQHTILTLVTNSSAIPSLLENSDNVFDAAEIQASRDCMQQATDTIKAAETRFNEVVAPLREPLATLNPLYTDAKITTNDKGFLRKAFEGNETFFREQIGGLNLFEKLVSFPRLSDTQKEHHNNVIAKLSEKDPQDRTAIMLAIAGGHNQCATYLMSKWDTAHTKNSKQPVCKLNDVDKQGQTAVMLAVRNGQVAGVNFCLNFNPVNRLRWLEESVELCKKTGQQNRSHRNL
jgi:hypothetical protein